MTYSGTLMLVIGVAAARLVFGVRDRLWPALVMPAKWCAVLAAADTRGSRSGVACAMITTSTGSRPASIGAAMLTNVFPAPRRRTSPR